MARVIAQVVCDDQIDLGIVLRGQFEDPVKFISFLKRKNKKK